jgi:hypothetical protein
MTRATTNDAVIELRNALWAGTRAKMAAGTFDRAGWLQHLRTENGLATQDARIDLEAIIVQGLRLGFIGSPDDVGPLLRA